MVLMSKGSSHSVRQDQATCQTAALKIKVLTLSGLRAPIPLVRNIVAIIYAYGNFLKKYICYNRKNTIYSQKINIMKEKYDL